MSDRIERVRRADKVPRDVAPVLGLGAVRRRHEDPEPGEEPPRRQGPPPRAPRRRPAPPDDGRPHVDVTA